MTKRTPRPSLFTPAEIAATRASMRVQVLADPTEQLGTRGRVLVHAQDLSQRRLGPGATVVAGWGDFAWRTRLHLEDGVWTVDPPAAESPPRTLDERIQGWIENAQAVLAEAAPNAIDALTRDAVAHRLLEGPVQHLRRQQRALNSLLSAHRVLRWATRRVLLGTVAAQALGEPLVPCLSPAWRLLAITTRLPTSRLRGTASVVVLQHDADPWCPTARRLRTHPGAEG